MASDKVICCRNFIALSIFKPQTLH